MKKELIVLIMAAGNSKRFNSELPKQFIKLNQKPIIWYSIYTFNKLDFVKEIYTVISEEHETLFKDIKNKYFNKISKFKKYIIGGKERYNSVFNGLKEIYQTNFKDYIAIHDAARPFIKEETVKKTFTEAVKHGACAPGIKVVDTIKLCKNNFIKDHLKRKDLIAVQTPQIFDFKSLFSSYQNLSDQNITDDTEIFSLLNNNIKIVDGDNDLFKLTYQQDLKIAKNILKRNKGLWI